MPEKFGGSVSIFDAGGKLRIVLDAEQGNMTIHDDQGRQVFRFDGKFAVLDIGGTGNEGDLRIHDDKGTVRIHLDGKEGDVKLLGADCAEDFDLDTTDELESGSVMIIAKEGGLSPCNSAYDRRVAGILSGAGQLRPGITLDKKLSTNKRMPLALVGKVFCKVEAQSGAIETGDLLTTSPILGHAMRASDPLRAIGAIIGKALRPHPSGTGLIPVLVALQ